ncbi:MAG: hypothetical protein ACRCV9_01455 [Burkholderiaceae bacterium]
MKASKLIVLVSASLLGSVAMAEGPGNVFPWDKPGYVEPTGASVSRAEVVAQARTAMTAGEIVSGERAPVQLNAQSDTNLAGKTRTQVAAEAREAMRLGLIVSGERSTPVPTAAQESMIAEAGLQARGASALAIKQ